MRIPLSWLRELTPVPADIELGEIGATLSDLGLVVEGTELVGEGLADVLVARVLEIESIKGADKIRKIVVDAGDRQLGIVCGAWNFEVGDLVPLAPVGAVLPGGFEIGKRKMRGVVSEGMLCSGRELGLSQDSDGLLILGKESSGSLAPGARLVDALGIVPDVVFDLEIAPNRPDCLSVLGVARDLAARMKLPLEIPRPVLDHKGPPAAAYASVVVDAPELCTRLTGRVMTGVTVGLSDPVIARRLAMCGMRSLNSVVDASNYVMLELGQPTHPYDVDLLDGHGIVARAGRPGEEIVTLDGVPRAVGETDCVIADAAGHAAGIGGIMGANFCEISEGTTEVLLEAAHFEPLAIARTARRLGLRTEASIRFERGCDPAIVEMAGARFCELVLLSSRTAGVPEPLVAPGMLDARTVLAKSSPIRVRTERVNALLGLELSDHEIRDLLEPIGFVVDGEGDVTKGATVVAAAAQARPEPQAADLHAGAGAPEAVAEDGVSDDGVPEEGVSGDGVSEDGVLEDGVSEDGVLEDGVLEDGVPDEGAVERSGVALVTPPTFRPDVTREEDVVEEVARHYGYERIPSRHRRAPGVGALTEHQRRRRALRRVLAALGAHEAWSSSFVSPEDHDRARLEGDEVRVTNPLTPEESVLRRSLMPGLLHSLARNASRRNPFLRLFEIGHVFGPIPEGTELPSEYESIALVLARESDGADSAVRAWRHVAEALGIRSVDIVDAHIEGLHPTRSARLVSQDGAIIGHIGEVDPEVVSAYGLPHSRVGWMDADAHRLTALATSTATVRDVSRFPSSDIDLAFAVDEAVSAAAVESVLTQAAGDLAVWVRLFDVYRGPGLDQGVRSLAFRVRLNALDRTLTDAEIASARAECVSAVELSLPAHLRS